MQELTTRKAGVATKGFWPDIASYIVKAPQAAQSVIFRAGEMVLSQLRENFLVSIERIEPFTEKQGKVIKVKVLLKEGNLFHSIGPEWGRFLENTLAETVNRFAIRPIEDNSGNAVFTINGFMSGVDEGAWQDWEDAVCSCLGSHSWNHVCWDAKTSMDIMEIVKGIIPYHKVLPEIWNNPALTLKKALDAISSSVKDPELYISFLSNPWHNAVIKAELTGVILAEIISRHYAKRPVTLMGNSLGARVIHSTLTTLSNKGFANIDNIHLLGGAVNNNKWQSPLGTVKGRCFNYYSDNDDVLKYLYSIGMFALSNPVGRYGIPGTKKVKNIDVTKHVSGHMHYKRNFSAFYSYRLTV